MILDSCVWIALLNEKDSLHRKAITLFQDISIDTVGIPDHVYSEILTILRLRASEEACFQFLQLVKDHDITLFFANRHDISFTTAIFLEHKKLSFVDSLLLYWKKNKGAKVITFDKALEKCF